MASGSSKHAKYMGVWFSSVFLALHLEMPNDTVGDIFIETMPGVAGENSLPRDRLQDRFRFVVHHGVAADLVLGRGARGVIEPFADFVAAPVMLDVRSAAKDAL